MKLNRLTYLLREYFCNTISAEDCKELLSYIAENDSENIEDVIDEILLELEADDEGVNLEPERAATILASLKSQIVFSEEKNSKKVIPFYKTVLTSNWYKFAAVLVIILSFVGLAIYTFQAKQQEEVISDLQNQKIIPGSNKATLTLNNEEVIDLNKVQDGKIRNGVDKLKDGLLAISTSGNNNDPSKKIVNNYTLSIPRGGEYQVTLADGTKVFLNSATILSFPSEFNGAERHVKLQGEAYFEVAKNKNQPFIVDLVDNTTVKVLGTHFNINAFADERAYTTTLVEGKVVISKNNSNKILIPGNQAIIGIGSNDIKVENVNIDNAIAWKNGYFAFEDESIYTIMKQISRWYDVDVVFQGDFETIKFGGTFQRSKSINELLKYLETLGEIKIEIEGRRIIVKN